MLLFYFFKMKFLNENMLFIVNIKQFITIILIIKIFNFLVITSNLLYMGTMHIQKKLFAVLTNFQETLRSRCLRTRVREICPQAKVICMCMFIATLFLTEKKKKRKETTHPMWYICTIQYQREVEMHAPQQHA